MTETKIPDQRGQTDIMAQRGLRWKAGKGWVKKSTTKKDTIRLRGAECPNCGHKVQKETHGRTGKSTMPIPCSKCGQPIVRSRFRIAK